MSDWLPLKILLVLGLVQVLGCGLWWCWRRGSRHEPPDAAPGLPWHYDPCLGQYVPDDHWHQTRPPHE